MSEDEYREAASRPERFPEARAQALGRADVRFRLAMSLSCRRPELLARVSGEVVKVK